MARGPERPGSSNIMKDISEKFHVVGESLRLGSELMVAVFEFGNVVANAAEKAHSVHREIQNEEIKRIHQVKNARHSLVMVTEKAFEFLERVNDLVWYCKAETMTQAREEITREVSLVKDARQSRERQSSGYV